LLQGHLHGAALGQSVEDTLGFCGIVDAKRQRETLGFLIAPGKGVDARQHLIAYSERRMDDFAATAIEGDFGAQALLVETKGLLTLAVEG